MALPIAPETVFNLTKFAYELIMACRAASEEFSQVGTEISGIVAVAEQIKLEVETPNSLINKLDDQGKSLRRQLDFHSTNCDRAFRSVEASLSKYNEMRKLNQKIWWAWSGHKEVTDLVSILQSYATQLDRFVSFLNLKGSGAILAAIDRLEEKAAQNPAHVPRGRQGSLNNLAVPGASTRASSVGTSGNVTSTKIGRHNSTGSTSNRANYKLECWLVQTMTKHTLFATLKYEEKQHQSRGQWKLDQMAKYFR